MPPPHVLPSPTIGTASTSLDGHGLIYDPRSGVLNVVNPTALIVWEACRAGATLGDAIAELVRATGTEPDEVGRAVRAHLEELRASGLVDGTPWVPPAPVLLSVADQPAAGRRTYEVLDERVEIVITVAGDRGAALRSSIADLLGPMAGEDAATTSLTITTASDGDGEARDEGLRLTGPGIDQAHPSVDTLLDALPTALNTIGSASTTCLALHAAGVVAPSGAVVVLPARSGAGKSTLAAELVMDGWAYLSDEMVGIGLEAERVAAYPKPLVLGGQSRSALGLAPTARPNTLLAELSGRVAHADAGPDLIVLPRFTAGAGPSTEQLHGIDAVVALAEHALNLRLVGQRGLDALVRTATGRPCHRLDHGGGQPTIDALRALVADQG